MDIYDWIEKTRERNRKEYEAIARVTDKTIAEVEADLTAFDPGMEEDDD